MAFYRGTERFDQGEGILTTTAGSESISNGENTLNLFPRPVANPNTSVPDNPTDITVDFDANQNFRYHTGTFTTTSLTANIFTINQTTLGPFSIRQDFYIIGDLVVLLLDFGIQNNTGSIITAGTPIHFWLPFGAERNRRFGVHPFLTEEDISATEIYIENNALNTSTTANEIFTVEYSQDIGTGFGETARDVRGILIYHGVGL